jgi:hypothetical protein
MPGARFFGPPVVYMHRTRHLARLRDQRGRCRRAPKFDLRTQPFKMCAADSKRIDGIEVTTASAVIRETGANMSPDVAAASELPGCVSSFANPP